MRRTGALAASFLAALATLAISPTRSSAAPVQLDCILNISGERPSAQPITITFDDSATTLRAKRGDRTYIFADVSISNIAISGSVGAVSLGIDRSSLGLVWQEYAADKAPAADFGQCRQNPASASPSEPTTAPR